MRAGLRGDEVVQSQVVHALTHRAVLVRLKAEGCVRPLPRRGLEDVLRCVVACQGLVKLDLHSVNVLA